MKKARAFLFWLILIVWSALLMVLAWRVKGFSDVYVRIAFPIWNNTLGRFSGLFKNSIGELLIYGGIVYAIITVISWIVRFFLALAHKTTLKGFVRVNTKVFIKIIIVIAFLQVQNCFVLYHTTPLYEGTEYASYVGNREDLIKLREMLVERVNSLCETFERNEKGEIIYTKDMGGIAKLAMQGLGEDAKARIEAGNPTAIDNKLRLLSGYYSTPKPLFKSDLSSQQNLAGIYFPFSLEANYNRLMYIANVPDTMCHELSHLKGFIFEDEATFLAYLGCMNSNDSFFEYAGSLDALIYVSNELKKELAVEPDIRNSLTKVNELVQRDAIFLTDEAWEEVNSDAWFSTELVNKTSETFTDKTLTLNGVEDGIISYSRVVDLLLKYYYGGTK